MPASGDIDISYPSKLKSIGISLLQPFKGAKKHHLMQCDICSFEWEATPLSKLQNFKKWRQGGCPKCEKIRRLKQRTEIRQKNLQNLNSRGLEVLTPGYDGRRTLAIKESTSIRLKILNKNCGHVFETDSKNLLARNVTCPVCNTQRKRENFQQLNLDRHDEYVKTATPWEGYAHTVEMATRRSYYNHKHIINPLDLKRGLAGEMGAYQLDHIVPVRYCFDNNIPADVCGHHTNLQMLSWEDNITARNYLKEDTKIPDIFIPFMTP